MSEEHSQRGGFSPLIIMLAGGLLLVGSVAAILLVTRGDGLQLDDGRLYRGIVFEAVAPEVDGEEARSRILLAGSMHMLRPADHPLPESYEKAFQQAETVFFELKPGEENGNAALVQLHTTYDDGTTMRDHLPNDVYLRASAAAEKMGIAMESVANRRPHVLAQGLSVSALSRAGFDRSWGVDTYFRTKAAESEKSVMGFESLEEQLAVFSSLSDARQEALLSHTLDEMEQHPDYGLRGMKAWRAGDVAAVAEIYAEAGDVDPALATSLFEDRHERWLPVIEENLAPGETLLIVVGAAHLCGENSLVDLLRQRGYAIGQW